MVRADVGTEGGIMTAKLTMLVGKYWNSMEVPRKLKKIIPRKHEYLQRYLDVLGITISGEQDRGGGSGIRTRVTLR